MAKKNNGGANVPLVSVIISMYNVEKYIEECLQSLLNQTLTNIEVIVADDCSTDKSVAVVKSIMPKFEGRLKLLQMKKNSGYPGVPRNSALKVAKGKYLYFLDSDDFIDATALEDLYKVAEEFDADVVHVEKYFSCVETDKGYEVAEESYQEGGFVDAPTLETSDIGKRIEDFKKKRYLWWACNKLFRRELWEKNKITFPAMTTFEDYFVVFMSLVTAKNYVRVPFVNYRYRIRNNSLSHKGKTVFEVIKNLVEAVRVIESFTKRTKFFIENPDQEYEMINFYVNWRLEVAIVKGLFVYNNLDCDKIYFYLAQNIFSDKPEKNIALTSYLFTLANYQQLLLIGKNLEIENLKKQLAEKNNTR